MINNMTTQNIWRAALTLLIMLLTATTAGAADITQNTAVVINSGNKAMYNINFGDGESQGITTTDFTDYTDRAGVWYSLDGCKLDSKPTKTGLYIYNGRKVVIK